VNYYHFTGRDLLVCD